MAAKNSDKALRAARRGDRCIKRGDAGGVAVRDVAVLAIVAGLVLRAPVCHHAANNEHREYMHTKII